MVKVSKTPSTINRFWSCLASDYKQDSVNNQPRGLVLAAKQTDQSNRQVTQTTMQWVEKKITTG